MPAVVFTDPQIASVGLTEASAREQGHRRRDARVRPRSVAGAALLRDDYVGRAKLVVDRATDTLVGATFVGSEVAELLHSATTAIVGKVPLETLWHAVPSYPDGQRDLAAAARVARNLTRVLGGGDAAPAAVAAAISRIASTMRAGTGCGRR